jgi:hypothetical protein
MARTVNRCQGCGELLHPEDHRSKHCTACTPQPRKQRKQTQHTDTDIAAHELVSRGVLSSAHLDHSWRR